MYPTFTWLSRTLDTVNGLNITIFICSISEFAISYHLSTRITKKHLNIKNTSQN
jgi:hypothetical protein